MENLVGPCARAVKLPLPIFCENDGHAIWFGDVYKSEIMRYGLVMCENLRLCVAGEGIADTTSSTFKHHTAKTTAEHAVISFLEQCRELPGISTLWCTFIWITYYFGAISYSICSINQEIARIFPAGFSCMATSITWLCFFGSFHSAHNERMLVR